MKDIICVFVCIVVVPILCSEVVRDAICQSSAGTTFAGHILKQIQDSL